MYGQTVRAEVMLPSGTSISRCMDKQSEVIVPSGTSMGNQSAECGYWEILTKERRFSATPCAVCVMPLVTNPTTTQ
jgi:hypothetical protein